MDRKRFERRTITGLLILLAIEVTLLTLHLMWGGFRPKHSDSSLALAGEVSESEHELRRRSLNSLVWEKTTTHDAVYYYDSILTLSQSTASLKLFKDTDLKLSENTLVTIEPANDEKHGEIRLRFHKGGFRARNPFATTKVENDNWSMEIKTGSEIDLRQADDNNYELQVNKGEVKFKNVDGEQNVTKEQVLRIGPQSTTQLDVMSEEELRWHNPPPKRIYTHKKEADIHLEWEGMKPSYLVHQTLGGEEAATPLSAEVSERSLSLPIGHHVLYLQNENKISKAMEVEVWAAPVIHLISPLPRNRIKTDTPVKFVWTSRAEASHFYFQLKGPKEKISRDLTDNSLELTFQNEDDVEWSIEATDSEGFAIPAPYSYPLFIRESPLAAPKLKSPMLRKPARSDEGASFQWLKNLILPEAQAEEPPQEYQAVFRWEEVERADGYIIEISETADFRTPIVTQNVSKNEFTWKKIQLKTYYWRVAAEKKNGRMGFFSEPELIDLSKGSTDSVEIKIAKPKLHKPPPLPLEASPEAKAQEIQHVKQEEPPPPPPNHYRFEWRPRYRMMTSQSAESVKAKLNGLSSQGYGVHGDFKVNETRQLRLDADFSNHKFEPKPAADYPYQSDLEWTDYAISGVIQNHAESWSYGASVRSSTQFQRANYASVEVKHGILLGAALENSGSWGSFEYRGDYTALVGSEFGVSVEQHLHYPLREYAPLIIGIHLGADYLIHTGGSTTSFSGQFSAGFEF